MQTSAPPSPPDRGYVSPPAPPPVSSLAPLVSSSADLDNADTDVSGHTDITASNTSGLDITLLVFIIIISVLILGLIILLLVRWCCNINNSNNIAVAETQEKVNSMESTTGQMEKEIIKTGLHIEDIQRNLTKLEASVENSGTVSLNTQRTQLVMEERQQRLRDEARRLDNTVADINEKIRNVDIMRKFQGNLFDFSQGSGAKLH